MPKKGEKMPEKQKAQIAHGNKGKKRSKETREKMSKTRKGKKHSEQHKANIAKGLKGQHQAEEHKNAARDARNARLAEDPALREKLKEAVIQANRERDWAQSSLLLNSSAKEKPVPGTLFRTIRRKIGVTQGQLSGILKVTQSAISNWELGSASPRSKHVAGLQDYLLTVNRRDLALQLTPYL